MEMSLLQIYFISNFNLISWLSDANIGILGLFV